MSSQGQPGAYGARLTLQPRSAKEGRGTRGLAKEANSLTLRQSHRVTHSAGVTQQSVLQREVHTGVGGVLSRTGGGTWTRAEAAGVGRTQTPDTRSPDEAGLASGCV